MKTEKQVFEKYKKNKKKLSLTGGSINPWFWRVGELSVNGFYQLEKVERDSHIKVLVSMDEKNRSTNDEYILNYYGPSSLRNNVNYFSIGKEDIPTESVQVGDDFFIEEETAPTELVTDVPPIEELITYGKEYLEEYLNLFFQIQNTRWKDDLKFAKVEKFIENTSNYMSLDELTISHIRAYKKIQMI
jgi:hypothetical protein